MITQLKQERDRIDAAIQALEALDKVTSDKSGSRKPGRPKGSATVAAKPRGRRKLSAEARERIAEAQRKRWAAQKKATK